MHLLGAAVVAQFDIGEPPDPLTHAESIAGRDRDKQHNGMPSVRAGNGLKPGHSVWISRPASIVTAPAARKSSSMPGNSICNARSPPPAQQPMRMGGLRYAGASLV
jgi:hypothetical protein